MNVRRGATRRAMLSLVAMLAGGSTFMSCDSKVKQAITSGLATTFLSLFDPSIILGNTDLGGNDNNSSFGGIFDQTP